MSVSLVLAPPSRLRDSTQIREVIRRGRRATAGSLTVHSAALAARQHAAPAAAFVVPRKVGTAVTRNAVTRRLRHLMRERLSSWPAGTSVVVRVAPPAGRQTFAELQADLDAALDRLQAPSRVVR